MNASHFNVPSTVRQPAENNAAFFQDVRPERGLAGGPGNPTALIRVYVQFGKLKEAGTLALQCLRKWLYGVSPTS